jgi:signal peptidase II
MADDCENRSATDDCSRSLYKFYALALAVMVADQATKLYAVRTLVEGTQITVLGPIMSFSLHYNTGAAWGLLATHTRWLTYIAAALTALVAIYGLKAPQLPGTVSTGLSLLLGGAGGNLVDRIRIEAVVDFIDFHFWPVFNVSDIAIVAGALLIVYYLTRQELSGISHDARKKA